MRLHPKRRTLLGLLVAAPALPALAQDWPSRPIRMVVPYPPGGASDVIARLLAQPMTETLGQTVIVENRVGANGGIAAELVARSAPDGYTLLMANAGPNALNQALLGRRVPYDAVADFSPISLVSAVPLVLAVHPGLPANNLQELLAYVRERPGAVNYATGGIGSAPHLTLEQLGSLASIRWVNVAFRGGQLAIAAVVGGQIPVIMDTAPVVLPQVRDGRLRGIAVTTAGRIPQAPDLPTIAEQGFPGFDATSWGGIMGPARLPAPVVERLHAAVLRAMALPQVRDALIRQGIEPRTSTPAEFAEHVASEVRRWTAVVQQANIQPE
ncbi:tripartite tricarboxylate transporter substrate binding protein [Siccirubricoccus sp. G192]|uniref:Bug family tripartite tricarboxylate transporter substrate binding protein n=1 Tax=Siccirubricoccus sp. G192 TaxID=2849651 RepID=UPI001C2C6D46|nr:tripartite tricarboxylate transporter substrate binding protein [Siccirubricoccus sp. G192]MBV1798153.1 tripartite tricarboxylate transporter substrate binding protein [Siccirubricoccus sp. G192]